MNPTPSNLSAVVASRQVCFLAISGLNPCGPRQQYFCVQLACVLQIVAFYAKQAS